MKANVRLQKLCKMRASKSLGTWHPATNGMVVEQQQIVTSQNLAPFFGEPYLQHKKLQDRLPQAEAQDLHLDERCLNTKTSDWHSSLIAIKTSCFLMETDDFLSVILIKAASRRIHNVGQRHTLNQQSSDFQSP